MNNSNQKTNHLNERLTVIFATFLDWISNTTYLTIQDKLFGLRLKMKILFKIFI